MRVWLLVLWLVCSTTLTSTQTLTPGSIDPTVVPITNTWTFVSGAPYLMQHSLVHLDSKLVAFGGWTAATAIGTHSISDDMYIYDIWGNEWTKFDYDPGNSTAPTSPMGRYSHTAVAYNGSMYLFGGENNDQVYNDMWVYNYSIGEWYQVDSSGWQENTYPDPGL